MSRGVREVRSLRNAYVLHRAQDPRGAYKCAAGAVRRRTLIGSHVNLPFCVLTLLILLASAFHTPGPLVSVCVVKAEP